ncbi:hypothetical protein [Fischerella thermalis]|uniref:hypothetical protein n=1 Tax=Fischerella thermalis TaxID=372787 RepID=UPI0015E0A53B|nr:hypothetical protein [Fischerella thermalis]
MQDLRQSDEAIAQFQKSAMSAASKASVSATRNVATVYLTNKLLLYTRNSR